MTPHKAMENDGGLVVPPGKSTVERATSVTSVASGSWSLAHSLCGLSKSLSAVQSSSDIAMMIDTFSFLRGLGHPLHCVQQ